MTALKFLPKHRQMCLVKLTQLPAILRNSDDTERELIIFSTEIPFFQLICQKS